MFKMATLFALVFPFTAMAENEMQCMGFQPEAKVACQVDGNTYKVHAFEEASCGQGRDGTLNDQIPIKNVQGPTWYDIDGPAEVSFRSTDGEPVTMQNCTEVY